MSAHQPKSDNVYRVKALKEEPYSIKEAEAGMGFTTDNGKRTTAAPAPAPMDVDNTV